MDRKKVTIIVAFHFMKRRLKRSVRTGTMVEASFELELVRVEAWAEKDKLGARALQAAESVTTN